MPDRLRPGGNPRIYLMGLVAIICFAVGCPSCEETFGDPPEDAFVVLMDASPAGLDPRFATTDATVKVLGLLHEGLITTDTRDGSIEYRLAEEIERTADSHYELQSRFVGRYWKVPMVAQSTLARYEIVLRDDAVFHDGTPVTAEDVEYTYTTLREVGSPLGAMSDRIASFEINDEPDFVDDYSFAIELTEPHAPFISDLGMGVLPRHLCEGRESCEGDPVGAGPFQFEDRAGELEVTLRAFDDHFEASPTIERLVFRVIRDDNARLLALLGGSADLIQNAVPPLLMPVVEYDEAFDIQTDPSFGYTYLAFNLEHPVLSDLKVRRAIAHAVNRDEIIEYKLRGMARQSTGMLAPDHWAYEPEVSTYDYDPQLAKELLDEAGYPAGEDGVRFEMEFKVSASNFRRSLGQLIAQQLGEVGIDVRVRSYEWGTFYGDIQSRNFEMTTMQWPSVLEPHLFHWIFHSDNIPSPEARAAGANRGGYVNERVDELLDKGRTEMDRQRRKEIYSEVQKILADELPYVSLWHPDNVAILRAGTEGYYTTPNARFQSLQQVVPADRNRR